MNRQGILFYSTQKIIKLGRSHILPISQVRHTLDSYVKGPVLDESLLTESALRRQ